MCFWGKVGRGTKITVTLPHRIAQDGDVNTIIEKVHAFDESNFKGKRILLAEDNELNAEIAITILEEAGFVVEHAEDGWLQGYPDHPKSFRQGKGRHELAYFETNQDG